jgi:DNA-binding transcriptional LysR family regulator
VSLRITHEVLGGTWEALRDGRADLVVGATNEPPLIPKLRWFELGVMEWVFAISPRHPLAKAKEPVERESITAHRRSSSPTRRAGWMCAAMVCWADRPYWRSPACARRFRRNAKGWA